MLPFRSWPVQSNFGDVLQDFILQRMLRGNSLRRVSENFRSPALLASGSTGQLARQEDVLWGTGIRAYPAPHSCCPFEVSVCAVRGPISAEYFKAPEVPQGDPLMLLPKLYPQEPPSLRHTFGYAPHRSEDILPHMGCHYIDVTNSQPEETIRDILSCQVLITSSLSVMITAEAYGVPVILIHGRGLSEKPIKYQDYLLGTKRRYDPVYVHGSIHTFALKPFILDLPKLEKKQEQLLEAFPWDLFPHITRDPV